MKNQYKLGNMKKEILIACLGQCVHVAGAYNFMNIADHLSYNCKFLGPATSISKIINSIKINKPHIVGLSYRLTPITIKPRY